MSIKQIIMMTMQRKTKTIEMILIIVDVDDMIILLTIIIFKLRTQFQCCFPFFKYVLMISASFE